MAESGRDELVVVAAWLHYADGLTHEAIAKKLNISRVKVTRLLQRARAEAVVQFKITRPLPMQFDLERRLQSELRIPRAVVVRTLPTLDETREELGKRGADHVRGLLVRDCRLGVGWSTTVSHIAHHFEAPRPPVTCIVTELVGGYPGHTNPYSISAQIAQRLAAPLETLPVPAFVQSPEARDAILTEGVIRSVLDHARKCDIALVGLGDVSSGGTMIKTGFVTEDEMAELRRQGAVGDVLGRFYDVGGRRVDTPLDARCISIAWEDILRIPHIVVLALGASKVEPILGAIRGGFCHSLITDTDTARTLLESP